LFVLLLSFPFQLPVRPCCVCCPSFVPFDGPNKRVAFVQATLPRVPSGQNPQSSSRKGLSAPDRGGLTRAGAELREAKDNAHTREEGQRNACAHGRGRSVVWRALCGSCWILRPLSSELTGPVRQSSPLPHVGLRCLSGVCVPLPACSLLSVARVCVVSRSIDRECCCVC